MRHKYAVSDAEQKAAEAINFWMLIDLENSSHVGYAPITHVRQAIEFSLNDKYIDAIKRRDAIRIYNAWQSRKARVENSEMKRATALSDEGLRKYVISSLPPDQVNVKDDLHIAHSNPNFFKIAAEPDKKSRGLSSRCVAADMKAIRVSAAKQEAARNIKHWNLVDLKKASHVGYAPVQLVDEAVKIASKGEKYDMKAQRSAIYIYNLRQKAVPVKENVNKSAMNGNAAILDEEQKIWKLKSNITSLPWDRIDLSDEMHIALSDLKALKQALSKSGYYYKYVIDLRRHGQNQWRNMLIKAKAKENSAQQPHAKGAGALADDGNAASSEVYASPLEKHLVEICDYTDSRLTLFSHAKSAPIDSEEKRFVNLVERLTKEEVASFEWRLSLYVALSCGRALGLTNITCSHTIPNR
ncbi:MAG: hypothetical protein COB66_06740 [Coxiella sp. (in: Bacteria)]|nr:MAG: hypothetical protein COB66_06740 [Coxiella sp. (in: g-proteobacteria)]